MRAMRNIYCFWNNSKCLRIELWVFVLIMFISCDTTRVYTVNTMHNQFSSAPGKIVGRKDILWFFSEVFMSKLAVLKLFSLYYFDNLWEFVLFMKSFMYEDKIVVVFLITDSTVQAVLIIRLENGWYENSFLNSIRLFLCTWTS